MNRASTFRELFWDNPMAMEATRMVRQFLRSGVATENRAANSRLMIALMTTLGGLYLWFIFAILHTSEDISMFLLCSEVFLITLAMPGALYGAIASEREKLTYEALIMTRLTPAQIVCGKLWWRIGFAAGIMALFVPPLMVSHLVAHRQPEYSVSALIWSQFVILSWAILLGAFSLWVSAKSKKGIVALLGIVATSLAFLALLPALVSLFNLDRPVTGYYGSGTEIADPMVSAKQCVSLLYSLSPFISFSLASNSQHYTWNGADFVLFWYKSGVYQWGPFVYLALAVLFIRGSIRTLRGLETPMADNRKLGR